MKTITVKLDDELYVELKKTAIDESMLNGNYISMNSIVVRLLKEYLAKQDSKPDTEQTIEPVTEGKYAHLLDDI
jgi:hypothetical protein